MNEPTEASEAQALRDVITEVLAPLVEADEGTLELVGRDGAAVEVRLGGACRGCPGQSYTVRDVLLPALQRVDPSVESVRVVTG